MNLDIIKKAYYNEETGFLSADKLYKKLKKSNPEITKKEVDKFVNNQYAAQITKRITKQKSFNSIVAYYPKQNYQLDILVYDRYEYHKYKYILCVIDVYSRYACCRAMTNRTNLTILDNIKSIFHEMGKPENINCDNEFNKESLNKYFKDNDIITYFSQVNEPYKNAIIERFNGTLAALIQRWRQATNRYDWYNVLNQLVKNYNNTEHRTIKATPQDIFFDNELSGQIFKKVINNFKIGDLVRKKLERSFMSKGDALKYSQDIYEVRKIDGNKLYLKNAENNHDVERFYKPYQLQKISKSEFNEAMKYDDDKRIHKSLVKERKINRELKKEGVEKENVTRELRPRKPTSQLESMRYGRVLY